MSNNKVNNAKRVPVNAFFDKKNQQKPTPNKPTNSSVFSVPAEPQNVGTSLQKATEESIEHAKKLYRKFWVATAILSGAAVLALLYKSAHKEYEHKFVVTPADESKITPEDQAYMDSLNNNHNEMRKKIGGHSTEVSQINDSVEFLQNQDPIRASISGAFNYIGNLLGISSNKEENKKPKKTQTEYVKPQLTAEENKKVEDKAKIMEPYLNYNIMTNKEITDECYAKLVFPKYEPLSDLRKNDDKKSKTEQKKVAENPVVVKNKDVVKKEENVQKTDVTETKTDVKLKPEIKESSEFVKKYVIDFIKRDLISKPAAYTEAIEAFTKEFGYKPNNDEIADYVIAKKGDCVSGVLIELKEKELGRNLTGEEKSAIGKLANNLQIRRKTKIKGATNDLIIAGDTIPTHEIKMLFR